MTEGAILHGMLHGREDFGFPVKIEERHNFFDMMGDIDLGAAHSLKESESERGQANNT